MTNEEQEILEQLEKISETKADEKTRAGKFIEAVINIFRQVAKGKLSGILIRVFPILLARIANLEGKLNEILTKIDKK